MSNQLPYFLFTNGKLKKVERDRPRWKGKTYMGQPYITGETQWNAFQDECTEYRNYIDSLPEITVHPELAKVWKEGERYYEGRDFKIDHCYPAGLRRGQEEYASAMVPHFCSMAEPIPLPVEESQIDDLWNNVVATVAAADIVRSCIPTDDVEKLKEWKKEVISKLKSNYHITRKK